MVMLTTNLTLKIAGNKPFISKILSEHHYPVPKFVEYDLTSLKKADNFLQDIKRPELLNRLIRVQRVKELRPE